MFEANNFNVARKITLEKNQLSVECNVACNDQIAKILSVGGEACVSGCEVISGSVNYSGYVDICLVFLNADGEICKINSNCPFSSKFSGEQIENGQKAIVFLKMNDISVDSVNGENVKLLCLIEEKCALSCNQEIKSVRCVDDSLCFLQEKIGIVNFIGEAEDNVVISSTLALREPIKRIILTESQALVKNVESGNNFVTISGDVVSRVLYLTENDKFESGYIYESFKQEIELENATRESKVEGYAFIKRDAINVTLDQQEKGGNVTLEIPLRLNVKAYEFGEAEVVKDLYSTKNELSITTSSFAMSQVCTSTLLEGKIDGTLTLDDEKPRVDKILFVGGNSVNVTNAYIADGEIVVEGVAKNNVVYLNDEDNAFNVVALEVPFVITDKFAGEVCDGQISVDAIVCDVDVVVKKGRELFYDARIKANVNFCYDVVSGVISNVDIADALPEKDCGMEVVFANAGQTSWEVAKQARVKEDMLLAQNPDLVFPLAEDSGIVLFYQKIN